MNQPLYHEEKTHTSDYYKSRKESGKYYGEQHLSCKREETYIFMPNTALRDESRSKCWLFLLRVMESCWERGKKLPRTERLLTMEFRRLEWRSKSCIDSGEKLIVFRFSFVLENSFHDLNPHHVEDAGFV